MIRHTLLLFVSIFITFSAAAQSSQIATLLHDGTLTNYYSSNGLVEAYEAATDGDVITLSSGMFRSTDIKKNITIRGAGMGLTAFGDNEAPTIITGRFEINCLPSDIYTLSLEGIMHNETITLVQADGMMISKCQMATVYGAIADSKRWKGITFVNCVISDLTPPNDCSMTLISSVVSGEFSTRNNDNFSANIANCDIFFPSTIYHCGITNSVVVLTKKSAYRTHIPASSSLNHCIIVDCQKYDATPGANKFWTDAKTVFKPTGFYQLNDELAAFIASDGHQAGIYGGSMPFNTTLSVPRVEKFNVSPKTTSDGKLSVDIEIRVTE